MSLTVLLMVVPGSQAGRFVHVQAGFTDIRGEDPLATLDSAVPSAGVVDAFSCIASRQQMFLSE